MKKGRIFALLTFLVMLSCIYSVSAFAGLDWAQHGGTTLRAFTSAQNPAFNANADINQSNRNMTAGVNSRSFISVGGFESTSWYARPIEPVIAQLRNNETTQYLIINNGNFTQVYDPYLNLIAETNSKQSVSGLAVADIDQDGNQNDILGFVAYNASLFALQSYRFTSGHGLIMNYQLNFTTGGTNQFSNLNPVENFFGTPRCVEGTPTHCYFIVSSEPTSTSTDFTDYLYDLNFNPNGTITVLANATTNHTGTNTRHSYSPVSIEDVEGDGDTDYLFFGTHDVILRDASHTLWTVQKATGTELITDAKLFKPATATAYKVVYFDDNQAGGNYIITSINSDGSTAWTRTVADTTIASTASTQIGRLAITSDYDGDGQEDIYVAIVQPQTTTSGNLSLAFEVLKGTDGTLLKRKVFSANATQFVNWNANLGSAPTNGGIDLTIARLSANDGIDDFILSAKDGVFMYDIKNDVIFLNKTAGGDAKNHASCVPADANLDSFLDVICSGVSNTGVFSSNLTNFNAVISSVTYDPSTTLSTGSTLHSIVSATDVESNPIKYAVKCNDTGAFSSDQDSNDLSCTYAGAGTFNNTVRVRDFFHGGYTAFSHGITVQSASPTCNVNGICESTLGETVTTCPVDCTVSSGTTVQGGVTIPNELVDPDNVNEGFLPQIYHGLIAFISAVFLPFFIIVAAMFAVLILMAVLGFLKKVVNHIGG